MVAEKVSAMDIAWDENVSAKHVKLSRKERHSATITAFDVRIIIPPTVFKYLFIAIIAMTSDKNVN